MNDSHLIVRLNRVDLLTLSGVVSSSLAVLSGLHGQVYLGIALLFLAMLGDALDGILARKFGLERAFGRYLDGFMDVLIYLVSPALLFWQLGFDGAYGMLLWLMLSCCWYCRRLCSTRCWPLPWRRSPTPCYCAGRSSSSRA